MSCPDPEIAYTYSIATGGFIMKIQHVDISELDVSPSKLLSEVVERGESLVVTRDGAPILEIRPYRQTKHVAKKDWESFFELVKQTEVPGDFLSRGEREQGVANDKNLDDAIRQAIKEMPLEKRKKLLAEAFEESSHRFWPGSGDNGSGL